MQNTQLAENGINKCNNDILIPRSILKKHEGVPRRKRDELSDQDDLMAMLQEYGSSDELGANETILGKQLNTNDSLLQTNANMENQYRMLQMAD